MVVWGCAAPIVVGFLYVTYLVVKVLSRAVRCRIIISRQNIPKRPSTHWLLGDGDIFKADVHKSGQEWSRKFNTGIFWRRTLHHTVVVISDPALAAEVLDRSMCPEFIDKPSDPMFYKAFDETTASPPQESHLSALTSDPLWQCVRKGTSPAFSPSNMRNAFAEVARTSNVLVETLHRIGSETPVNIDVAVQCQAFDAIGSVGFGKKFNAAADLKGEGAKACHAVEQAAQSLVSNLRNPIGWIPFTQAWRQHKANVRRVLAVMRGLLQEVHDRGPPSPEDESIAAHLMRVHDKAGNVLPHARQWSELSIFFYAGVRLRPSDILSCYDISQHPEVEHKVVEELDQLGLLATSERPTPRSLELADLSRLTYLNCVIKESMRKRPVLPLMFRRAVKDVRIGPYLFPAGTIIEVHVLAMNTRPLYWDQPDDFLPERWLEPGAEYARPIRPVSSILAHTGTDKVKSAEVLDMSADKRGIYTSATEKKVKRTLNFGDGRRICIGMPLAKLILPTNLALLLSQFSFRLADKMGGPAQVEANQVWRITVQPLHGLHVHCIPRSVQPPEKRRYEETP